MKKNSKPSKQCCVCSKVLIGRKDKVFCNNRCKYLHHKAARKQINSKFKYSSKRELRNLVVLEGIFGTHRKEIIIHKNLLFKYGFDLHSFLKTKASVYQLKQLTSNLISIKRKDTYPNYMYQIFEERWSRIFPVNFEQKKGTLVDGVESFFKEISFFNHALLTVRAPLNKHPRQFE